ncbi:MAG: exosome complex RNA-binding protein Rrp4 [Candidatus Pacearchaeota archaeon]
MNEAIKNEAIKEEKVLKAKNEIEVSERKLVVPGEVVASGYEYLAGEGCAREERDIVAIKFGILSREGNLFKVIPIGGVYLPRVGNVVIGQIIDVTFNGWFVDIYAPYQAFLPVTEVMSKATSKWDSENFINYYDIGDIIITKVKAVQPRSVTLTMHDRGLTKITSGLLVKIGPSRVARIIGKQGSMVNVIKDITKTKIIVGQNGIVWVKGENAESELLAKEAIELVAENPLLDGLTEKVKKLLEEKMKKVEEGSKKERKEKMEEKERKKEKMEEKKKS